MDHTDLHSAITKPATSELETLERTCFVIMPFGKRKIDDRKIDFDAIYNKIFKPAIEAVKVPEGPELSLIAKRTDMDAFSSSINQDMFEYLTYSRMAFADITGYNPNVLYEIGARHAVQESGTVVFRQQGHPIPFDIQSIKIFEYEHKPAAKVQAAIEFISRVMSETLRRNRLDSPVRQALRAQYQGRPLYKLPVVHGDIDEQRDAEQVERFRALEVGLFMRDAEEALRVGNFELAQNNYWAALRIDPIDALARMRHGLALKRLGRNYEALEEFTTVTKLAPDYGEAWREKGVVEGLIARAIPAAERPKWLADGTASLTRATHLIPEDFDAWASLAGVLKNVHGDTDGALAKYRHAVSVSDGHPYPLLNVLKLELKKHGKLKLNSHKKQLQIAEEIRRAQTEAEPPADTPWSFFDLAEMRLYQSDEMGFLHYLKRGLKECDADWQPRTFLASLEDALINNGIDYPGLTEGLEQLRKAEQELKAKGD